MRHYATTTVRITVASIGLALLTLIPVNAAQDSQSVGQALEISPPVLSLKADPGETVTGRISLRDISPTQLIVSNEINDFTAGGEDGTPKLLLDEDGKSGEPSPYSLRPWIQPLPKFTLQPKEINQLPVTLRVPGNASPGGYFAVIRFTATPPNIEGTGVSLSPSLGTLVFLRVSGDAKEALQVEDFFASQSALGTDNLKSGSLFESKPINFFARLKNTGNTFEQPTGQIQISDMFGKTIAGINVNLNKNNILPGTNRTFGQSLDESAIGNKALFGRYKAKLTINYGSGDAKITDEVVFWVLPYRLIILIIAFLIVAAIVLRIAMQRYNERIINRSRSRRRRRK